MIRLVASNGELTAPQTVVSNNSASDRAGSCGQDGRGSEPRAEVNPLQPGPTTVVPADAPVSVATLATTLAGQDLTSVLVLGWRKDRSLFVASLDADIPGLIYMMDVFRHNILPSRVSFEAVPAVGQPQPDPPSPAA